MADHTLLGLPNEVLRLILSALADAHLPSLFTARRTCTTIDRLVTDIHEVSIAEHGLSIYAFLQSHFAPLFRARCLTPAPGSAHVMCPCGAVRGVVLEGLGRLLEQQAALKAQHLNILEVELIIVLLYIYCLQVSLLYMCCP
ncbi:hypothetical protein M011DRAFT_294193 [Sporormia fimetaria CBS 119925]|uniref:F-box domain-containing protein n=1 Tax=Sporormia fimetaria CBS 119925 TaxID=1340428 RepID=A0A6A6UVJ4_9PLEO|nr:hypothetical protein M011DRAFT_294193 [Sporormia fimetaria CBS 119925]